MTIHKGFLYIACIVFGFVSSISVALGMDEDGCLFCHRYPGLVSHKQVPESADKLTPLHIDEAAFAESTHGEVKCKTCHTTISQVPHTGNRRVDCTTSCHQDVDVEDIVTKDNIQEFHLDEQSYITEINDMSSCTVCHPIYPHSENKVVRAFLNMHTGFMQCTVCHVKAGRFNNIEYKWSENQNAVYKGKPFGTFYIPKTKNVRDNNKTVSRISVSIPQFEKQSDTVNKADIDKAKVYLVKMKNHTGEALQPSLDYFHRNIEKKEFSTACSHCHSHSGILDFKVLGFSKKKSDHLRTINIKGLVAKYKNFFFPKLFDFQ